MKKESKQLKKEIARNKRNLSKLLETVSVSQEVKRKLEDYKNNEDVVEGEFLICFLFRFFSFLCFCYFFIIMICITCFLYKLGIRMSRNQWTTLKKVLES